MKDPVKQLRWFFAGRRLLWGCAALACIAGCSDSVDKVSVSGASTQATVCIDATTCIACIPRYCYESCPQRAISEVWLSETRPVYVIDPQKCIRCGVCINKCPYGAISWKR
jgi:Formate hydrogenlyase subunit 6/NADH:ubiquinone oxidoreductase 23 kD subunit (chain I)